MVGIHAFWSKPTLTGTQGHHLEGTDKFEMYDFGAGYKKIRQRRRE